VSIPASASLALSAGPASLGALESASTAASSGCPASSLAGGVGALCVSVTQQGLPVTVAPAAVVLLLGQSCAFAPRGFEQTPLAQ
jgi:hypothetical protein